MLYKHNTIERIRQERPLFVFDFEEAHTKNPGMNKPCHAHLRRIKSMDIWRYQKVALLFRGHFVHCCGGMVCRVLNAARDLTVHLDVVVVVDHLVATRNVNLKNALRSFKGCVQHRGEGLQWWQ